MTSVLKFTPDKMDEVDIEAVHVGRTRMLESVVERIRKMIRAGGTMNVIFTGQRGMGKTHMLKMIRYRLSGHIVPVAFAQEEYSMSTVDEFFSRVLEVLGEDHDGTEPTYHARGVLKRYRAEGKPVVIFAENLQTLFLQMEEDLGKLRSVIQEDESFFIVGSALAVFEQVASMDAPFYNFFEINRLRGLDVEEIRELVHKCLPKKNGLAGRRDSNRHELDGLRALTGGNPRLIHMLCDGMNGKNYSVDLEDSLMALLDQMTPMYKTRMEAMSTETRKIFNALAAADGPLTPTELANRIQAKTTTVTAQLNRMKNESLVGPVKFRRKKETRYQITERPYRVWIEFTESRGSAKLEMLAGFLRLWRSEYEIRGEHERTSDMFQRAWQSKPMAKRVLALTCDVAAMDERGITVLPDTVERFIALGELEYGRNEVENHKKEAAAEPDKVKRLCKEVIISNAELIACDPRQDQNIIDTMLDKMQELDGLLRTRDYEQLKGSHAHTLLGTTAFYASEFENWRLARNASDAGLSCVPDAYCHKCTILNVASKIRLKQHIEALETLESVLGDHEKCMDDDQISDIFACRINVHADMGDHERVTSDSRYLLEHSVAKIAYVTSACFRLSKFDDARKVLEDNVDRLKRSKDGVLREAISNILLDAVMYVTPGHLDEREVESIVGCMKVLEPVTTPDMFIDATGFLAKHDHGVENMDRCMRVLSEAFSDGQLGPMRILKYAVGYVRTGDTDLLEKLHPEHRDLAVSMVLEMAPSTEIPYEVRHSLE